MKYFLNMKITDYHYFMLRKLYAVVGPATLLKLMQMKMCQKS